MAEATARRALLLGGATGLLGGRALDPALTPALADSPRRTSGTVLRAKKLRVGDVVLGAGGRVVRIARRSTGQGRVALWTHDPVTGRVEPMPGAARVPRRRRFVVLARDVPAGALVTGPAPQGPDQPPAGTPEPDGEVLVVNALTGGFGVRGDGVHDDTAGLTKAIDLATRLGATLLLPRATYLVRATSAAPTDSSLKRVFVLRAPVRITGQGPGSVLRVAGEASTTLFWVEGAVGGSISDLRMEGSGLPSPHRSSAVRLVASQQWTVQRTEVVAWGSHGLVVRDGSRHNRLLDNTVERSVSWNGIELIHTSANEVSGNTVLGCADQGIEVRNSSDNVITDNLVVDAGRGLVDGPCSGIGLEHGSHRNVISNNRIVGSQRSALQLLGDCRDNLVTHNRFDGNRSATQLVGVLVHEAGGTRPEGNRFTDNVLTGAGRDGFLLRGAPGTTLDGNLVRGAGRSGIRVEAWNGTHSSDRVTLSGNQVSQSAGHGIDVQRVDRPTLVGNDVGDPVEDPVARGADGLRVSGCTDVTLLGNRSHGYRHGLRLAGCTGVRTVGNDTRGLTSPVLADTTTRVTMLEATGSVLTGAVVLDEGTDLVAGTGTGSRIGTAAQQRLGFYGATPVPRPAAPTPATDAQGAVELANQLRQRLVDLGLIG